MTARAVPHTPSTFPARNPAGASCDECWRGVSDCWSVDLVLGARTGPYSASAGLAHRRARSVPHHRGGGQCPGRLRSARFAVPLSARSGWPCSSVPPAPPGYRTRVRVLPNGEVWAGFSRVINGQEILLLSEPTRSGWSAGDTVVVEGQVIGTDPVQLSVRIRVVGVSRHRSGSGTFTDMSESRLTAPGQIRAWAYLSRAATDSARVTFSAASATIADRRRTRPEPEPEPSKTPDPTPPKPTPTADADAEADTHPDHRRRRRPSRRRRRRRPLPRRRLRRRRPDAHATPVKPTPTPTPSPTPAPPRGQAFGGNTGVPAGTQLRHDGDITVTQDGTVLSGLDIHGFVIVQGGERQDRGLDRPRR